MFLHNFSFSKIQHTTKVPHNGAKIKLRYTIWNKRYIKKITFVSDVKMELKYNSFPQF